MRRCEPGARHLMLLALLCHVMCVCVLGKLAPSQGPSVSTCQTSRDAVYGGNLVDCSGLGMRELPGDELPHNVTTLILQDNNMTSLSNNSFLLPQLAFLRHLNIRASRVTHIEVDALSGLGSLETLDLEHNNLELCKNERSFPAGMFKHVPNLRHLFIGFNTVNDPVSPMCHGYSDYIDIFSSLPRLRNLSIDALNDTLHLGREFAQLTALENVTVLCNFVQYITNDSLQGLRQLAIQVLSLVFFEQEIMIFELGLFENLPNLMHLTVDGSHVGNHHILQAVNALANKTMTSLYFRKSNMFATYSVPSVAFRDGIIGDAVSRSLRSICLQHFSWIDSILFAFKPKSVTTGVFSDCVCSIDLSCNKLGNVGWVPILFEARLLKRLQELTLSSVESALDEQYPRLVNFSLPAGDSYHDVSRQQDTYSPTNKAATSNNVGVLPDLSSHTFPHNGSTQLPDLSSHTFPHNGSTQLPDLSSHTFPHNGSTQLPDLSSHTFPHNGSTQLPDLSSHTFPHNGSTQLPDLSSHTFPHNGSTHLPDLSSHTFPHNGSTHLRDLSSHTFPHNGSTQLPDLSSHTFPHNGSTQLPDLSSHTFPHNGSTHLRDLSSHTFPHNGSTQLPDLSSHTFPHNGSTQLPYLSSHTFPHNGSTQLPDLSSHTFPHNGSTHLPDLSSHTFPHNGSTHLRDLSSHTFPHNGSTHLRDLSSHTFPHNGSTHLPDLSSHTFPHNGSTHLRDLSSHTFPHNGSTHLPDLSSHTFPHNGSTHLRDLSSHTFPHNGSTHQQTLILRGPEVSNRTDNHTKHWEMILRARTQQAGGRQQSKFPYNGNITYYFPPSLRKLKIINMISAQMTIGTLHIVCASNDHFRELYWVNNQLMEAKGVIYGVDKLTLLDISGSEFDIADHLFDTFSGLQVFLLREVKPDTFFKSISIRRLLRNLTNLRYLDVSNNRLNSQLFPPDTFASTPNISHVILPQNRFSNIPFDLQTTPNLRVLDLSSNAILFLTDQEMLALDNHVARVGEFLLMLEDNAIACVCSQIGFVVWMLTTPVTIQQSASFQCLAEDGPWVEVSGLEDIPALSILCWGRLFLMAALILTSLVVIAFLSAYLGSRFRTSIIAFLSKLLIRPQGPEDYKFGVFIGYADDDYRFAINVLMKYLEDDCHMVTYLHQRDLGPGYRIELLDQAITDSWRVLLVLSREFLQNYDISEIVMQLACHSVTAMNRKRVFVLVEKGQVHAIPSDLYDVLDEARIIFFDDFHHQLNYEQQQRIKYCLRQSQ